MRRAAAVVLLLAALVGAVVADAGAGAKSWAHAEIKAVVAAGAMAPSVADFRPDDAITRGELHEALLDLGRGGVAPGNPDRVVTIRELDAVLVAALGLQASARAIRLAVVEAGLSARSYLGTETVARLLGLRVNHPQGQEELERQVGEPASRAEAAYSLARVIAMPDWEVDRLVEQAASISLPVMRDVEAAVVTRALRLVGSPYVWAGMSEKPQQLYYGSVPGGFDCSGFVWRVYKLEPFAEAPGLGSTLTGRTTYAMSGETRPAARIKKVDALLPGDVVFFGSSGKRSKPAEIGHMGIYVGGGWFVHSSRGGVTLQPLTGYYLTGFAFARRPLTEAGYQG